MHWNVAPEALPESARLVLFLDRWLNNCIYGTHIDINENIVTRKFLTQKFCERKLCELQ